MASYDFKNSIEDEYKTLFEFAFLIRINHSKQEAYNIKKNVAKRMALDIEPNFLTRRDDEIDNATYLFIKKRFDRHFKFLGDTKSYLTNYEEKEGSLIISFSLILISTISNYGGIRETIDYFNNDLDFIFNDVLKDEYSVSSKFYEKEESRTAINLSSNTSNLNPEFASIRRQIKLNKVFIGVVFFLALIVATNFFLDNENKMDSQKVNEMIRAAIKENDNQHKLETLYLRSLFNEASRWKDSVDIR